MNITRVGRMAAGLALLLSLGACQEDPYYRTCAEAEEAGAAPLHVGDPGYALRLDADKNGTACE